jgi:hypothetical protein
VLFIDIALPLPGDTGSRSSAGMTVLNSVRATTHYPLSFQIVIPGEQEKVQL